MANKAKYPRFRDYTGGMLWRVSHPDYGSTEVLAPSAPTAILTAAGPWGETWTRYDFYAQCIVSLVGNRKHLVTQIKRGRPATLGSAPTQNTIIEHKAKDWGGRMP